MAKVKNDTVGKNKAKEADSDLTDFTASKIKPIISDLFTPNPYIYWFDFIVSISIGWFSFYQCYTLEIGWLKLVYFILAVLGLYRSLIFIHELAHLKQGTFNTFRWVWNTFCGFPLQIPSFLYHGVHNDHHIKALYGTNKDGEYLPFGAEPPRRIYIFLTLVLASPLIFLGRFLILTPLSLVIPAVRTWAWEHVSSLSVDVDYRRPPIADRYKAPFFIQDIITSLYSWAAVIMVFLKIVSPMLIVYWYLVAVCISYLNAFRTLAAHRYRHRSNEPMSNIEQYLDSVNVVGNPVITALWAPVGLRFHGLHHMFPAMPYHSFGKAHKRLMRELPEDSYYWETVEPDLLSALKKLWKDAKSAQEAESVP